MGLHLWSDSLTSHFLAQYAAACHSAADMEWPQCGFSAQAPAEEGASMGEGDAEVRACQGPSVWTVILLQTGVHMVLHVESTSLPRLT